MAPFCRRPSASPCSRSRSITGRQGSTTPTSPSWIAEQVVDDATAIGDSDVQPLRDLGLSETEIMDVILAAAARCFFSKTLDALGVLPDASYRELEPELREALVVGRPIADA